MRTKQHQIEAKIKAITPSSGFVVKDESERKRVLQIAKNMKRYGQIDFDVATRENKSGGFTVGAI